MFGRSRGGSRSFSEAGRYDAASVLPRGSGRSLAALSAAFVIAVLITSSLGEAATSGASGWSPSASKMQSGCSTAAARLPHWFSANHTGQLRAAGSSKTCTAVRGGSAFGSASLATVGLVVATPVNLAPGTGGVNVSWKVAGALSTTGSVAGAASCPTIQQSASYNLGYTWYNFSQASTSCYSLGSASLSGFAYLEDVTTGTMYSASSGWTGIYNVSGLENVSYAYSQNYSNRSYWASNASYNYSFVVDFGRSGTVSGTWLPTWYVNGTFSASDVYEVISELSASSQTNSAGYSSGSASALASVAGPGRGIQLRSVTIW